MVDKLEPAVRAAADAARSAVTGEWRACRCSCTTAHPDDQGVCDGKAVLTRRIASADVALCAPCAVAQGVAEFPRGLAVGPRPGQRADSRAATACAGRPRAGQAAG